MVASTLDVATELALQGDLLQAQDRFQQLLADFPAHAQEGLILNNLAAVEAALGERDSAIKRLNPLEGQSQSSQVARRNLSFLRNQTQAFPDSPVDCSPQRIAILSLLFNWPSTGGGTVHTKELAEFLAQTGYAVRHIYARYEPWGVGQVQQTPPYENLQLRFSSDEWNEQVIIQKFRQELNDYQPDWVIVTDSWNSKPLLVEAAAGFRTLIRIAALESLCPLNNVRLLMDSSGQVRQCGWHQLADPETCRSCVAIQGTRLSGPLHQAERELVGFGTPEYSQRLQQAFAQVEGVLAVNPAIAELVRPHTKSVHVIPSGFDLRRFTKVMPPPPVADRKLRLLFAGLTQEFMKGFHVLREAGRLLWQQRQDFEIWATGESQGYAAPWLKFLGWQSQEQLPQLISACDALVFPTIAQEALGRTAVEAMACGRPVIASQIGGLEWVVEDGVTGLLCRPGDAYDLAARCDELLNNMELRARLGVAGRMKFLGEFTWDSVIEKHYRPLLGEAIPERRVDGPERQRVGT